MLSSILQLLFNAADVIVVGRFAGADSLAAVSSCGALVNLIVNVFIGLSVGCNVVVARNLGLGDGKAVKRSIDTSIIVAIIGGLFLLVFGIFASPVLLRLMDSPDNVLPLSAKYLRIYFLGMPAMMIYNFGASILRADGDTKRPLYFLTIAGVINVVLNVISVIFFKWGVVGVGLATTVSQYVSGGLVFYCLLHEEGLIKFEFEGVKVHKEEFVEIVKIGLPAGVQGVFFSLSNVIVQKAVNSFGSVVMAGSGASSNIEGFVYVSMNALHQACVSFTSQNYGAKNYKRLTKILLTSIVIVIITGLTVGGLAVYFGRTLLGFYSPDPMVIEAGYQRLFIICIVYFTCGIMDVMVAGLRGIGYSVLPMIFTLIGACLFRIVWINTVFVASPTIKTIYLCYPISWILTAVFHIITYVVVRIKLSKRIKNEQLQSA